MPGTVGWFLVAEQLARSDSERSTEALDRIGADQAEPATRSCESVYGGEAQAGELAQSVGRHAPCFQQFTQPQPHQTYTALADDLTKNTRHVQPLVEAMGAGCGPVVTGKGGLLNQGSLMNFPSGSSA